MLKLKVFIISVGIAFLIMIIHSLLTKGWRFTFEFFVGGFLFGFVREFYYFSFIRSYEFPNMPIKLLNVPVFIPVGWIFTFYLAYEFVHKLIEPKTERDYKNFVIFAAFFSTFICIPIETAAMNMNWWSLSLFYINDNIAPFLLMGGWSYTTVIFFCIFFFAKKKLPREQLWYGFFLFILVLSNDLKWATHIGFWGWAIMQIIGWVGMIKYNKEITFIFAVYLFIVYCRLLFNSIPNAMFVTTTFICIFIYTFIKLRYIDVTHQIKK